MHFDWTITAGDVLKAAPWGVFIIGGWRYLRKQFRKITDRFDTIDELKTSVEKLLEKFKSHEEKLEALAWRVTQLEAARK